jgi:HK97 family phage prohead protease/HK97 family phage major capsid protein
LADTAEPTEQRAEWDASYINDLPDSAFACIDAGGEKDESGRTVPRSLRHYPHHNAAGEVDRPHLSNALARVAQAGTTTCGEGHLNSHAEALGVGDRESEPVEPLQTREIPAVLELRDMQKRELGIHIVPWDTIIQTNLGSEMFVKGAFDDINPATVRLRMSHMDPPAGKGISLEQHDRGADMVFKVSQTQRGDEILVLAADGVASGASVGFNELPGGTRAEQINGRRVRVHRKVDLREVSTTWQPAYEQAAVTYIRSKEGEASVAEQENAVVEAAPPAVDESAIVTAIRSGFESYKPNNDAVERLTEKFDKFEERQRSEFVVPGTEPARQKAHAGNWLQYALSALSGDRISTNDTQYRELADLVTSDNLGVVPDAFSTELIGVIDPSRPFMSSTRRLPTPSSGMTLHVPKIITRPTVGIQSEEKAELASTPTSISTVDFSAVTKGGAGDLSLQILKRSDPSFLDLYLRLLAEAYAMDSESEALESLLGSAVDDGNTMDPENAQLGDAFVTSFSAIRRGPDTIWLSSEAVGAFIDAVNQSTGMPIYSSITADMSVPGGISGTIKGLRPVHVPELGPLGADVIIGPSSGFAWAEDGTYTLQVDVPARAGRDVALVGILWFAPWYPEAFTVYTLAS